MKKFNSRFIAGETKVQLPGEYGYRLVKSIHETRNWINIEGFEGSFQYSDIIGFTNSSRAPMFPVVDDLYIADQYGSVYEKGGDSNKYIGKLNGQSLSRFVSSL